MNLRPVAALLLLLLPAISPAAAAPAVTETPEGLFAALTGEAALGAVPAPATAEVRIGGIAFESLAYRWNGPEGTAEVAPEVTLGHLLPRDGAAPETLAALRRGLLEALFEAAQVELPADLDPERPARDLGRLFATRRAVGEGEVAEALEAGAGMPAVFGFSLSCEIRVAKGRFLSLLVHRHLYSPGAAHGSSDCLARVFDLGTGALLPRDALIRDDEAATRAVFPLVERRIRAARGIAPDADLAGEGFFPENFGLAANVFIDEAGIGFRYNAYEIACYAAGPDEAIIPWADYPADALPGESPLREFLPARR